MRQRLAISLATLLAGAACAVASNGAAMAAAGHHGAHDAAEISPAARQPDRTIALAMVEKDDGSMGFEPSTVTVRAGEAVRFEIRNDGRTDHEFVPGDHAALMAHKAEMEAMPDMAHGAEGALRLAPGASGSLDLAFEAAGTFEFACLIPGHYEAGMHGVLTVTGKTKGN
ncbi:cupredoxin domain-containing protein [Jiella sonneratiae]|uniref:Cupredoxin domain-containing protein n=1 Tax=Jiella sonneratiae TaxID=2816856 RepID=A0ABS3J572_9HYPH|nr:cupredoxin domain-containing protein [Jiella sonneratiae]MBO0903716.1 cupredoxin domain-containing protein [Jiella sonneratiae]